MIEDSKTFPLNRIHLSGVSFQDKRFQTLTIGAFTLAALYLLSRHNYLLFHSLAEIFCVIVACGTFMLVWNTRALLKNNTILLIGTAYLFIAGFDLLHTLTYKGMRVFPTDDANTPTQLWIAARYIESISLFAAPFFLKRTLKIPTLVAAYTAVSLLVMAALFHWHLFPDCYIEGAGLTPFKKISEFIICVFLVGAAILLQRIKDAFDASIFGLLIASIGFSIAAELAFTFYISVYGLSNLIGHFFKLVSFYLIYKAIVETGLRRPYKLVFRELKLSETKLRKSKARFEEMTDMLPSGICEVGVDKRISYINEAGLRMLGRTREDFNRGIEIMTAIHPEYRKKAEQRFRQAMMGISIGSTEYRIVKKDGSESVVIVNSAPVSADGRVHLIRTSLTDVTDLKKLQKQLQQAQKMEAVAVLAGGVAHEVNNALMGLVGHMELVRMELNKTGYHSTHLGAAGKSCDRIAALTQKLLAYSRGGNYRSEIIDLEKFIRMTVAEIKPFLVPGIRVDIDGTETGAEIKADPIQLQMVTKAILINASEAIENGDGRVRIHIQACDIPPEQAAGQPGMRPGRYACLRVTDNGNGMTEAVRSKIFQPFFTTRFVGRGLGMAAAYGIVKSHNGWIGVDSAPGKGTTVRVYLPMAASHRG